MNIALTVTGDKASVLSQLHEGSTQSDPEQRECENAIRGTLLDYLEENAAPDTVTVSVSISLNYTQLGPDPVPE